MPPFDLDAARAALAAVFDLDSLLDDDEREWQHRARRVARDHIDPVVEDDFEQAHFRRELIPLIAKQGLLGMHIDGYGCAGASAVAYGAACLELEAADSGWRTFVSVQGVNASSTPRSARCDGSDACARVRLDLGGHRVRLNAHRRLVLRAPPTQARSVSAGLPNAPGRGVPCAPMAARLRSVGPSC